MPSLLKAIGSWKLTGYFEDLDAVREHGQRHMAGAPSILMEMHAGMVRIEADAVAKAWRDTFDETLSAEDRADNALERENA